MNKPLIPYYKKRIYLDMLKKSLGSINEINYDQHSLCYQGYCINYQLSLYDIHTNYNTKTNTLWIHLDQVDKPIVIFIHIKAAVRYLISLPF